MQWFYPENRTLYEIMCKNAVEQGRPQMTIWHMRIACWIPKATNTNTVCVTLFTSHCNNCYTKASQCDVIRTFVSCFLLATYSFIVFDKYKNLQIDLCIYLYSLHERWEQTALQSALIRRTLQPFTESDDTRCCDNTIYPPEDGHVDARNMSRIVM